ncbi:hypothetical protein PR048_012905 [Dryococelus australis]|uniref:Uncharacterized protein n=1 Tax=Dryococelus australis TaxID=614101 RepID=A0ABQ9HQN5_9NEOP|nr:hypothetical protein PR048_012905 [Dryococelus australis]
MFQILFKLTIMQYLGAAILASLRHCRKSNTPIIGIQCKHMLNNSNDKHMGTLISLYPQPLLSMWALDTKGPLPVKVRKKKYFLVMMEYTTRCVVAKAVPSIDAAIKALLKVVNRGCVRAVLGGVNSTVTPANLLFTRATQECSPTIWPASSDISAGPRKSSWVSDSPGAGRNIDFQHKGWFICCGSAAQFLISPGGGNDIFMNPGLRQAGRDQYMQHVGYVPYMIYTCGKCLALGMCWTHTMYMLDTFHVCAGHMPRSVYVLDTFSVCDGHVQCMCWTCSVYVLDTFSVHAGYMQCPCWTHPGNMLDMIHARVQQCHEHGGHVLLMGSTCAIGCVGRKSFEIRRLRSMVNIIKGKTLEEGLVYGGESVSVSGKASAPPPPRVTWIQDGSCVTRTTEQVVGNPIWNPEPHEGFCVGAFFAAGQNGTFFTGKTDFWGCWCCSRSAAMLVRVLTARDAAIQFSQGSKYRLEYGMIEMPDLGS